MKIELKKISYNARLSQETSAWGADIWIDGKMRGTVSNHGTGGCDNFHPHALEEEIEAYAKTLPKYADEKFEVASQLLGDLLDNHLTSKQLTSKLKKNTIFLKGAKLYQMKAPARPKAEESITILNDLPFEKALELFKAHG